MTDSVPQPADPTTDLRQTWADRFQRFAQAELSVAHFCRDEGVSVQTFYYWRRKLLAPTQQHQQAEPAAQLIPIHILPAPLHILLPGGAVIYTHLCAAIR